MTDGLPLLNASAKCLPVGIPWQMDLNMPFQIFQSKDRFDILFEEYHGLVTISLDPAKAPDGGYMGRSVAHWDGDTLVVETIVQAPLWLDVNGTPASKFSKLASRIRKVRQQVVSGSHQYPGRSRTTPLVLGARLRMAPDMALFAITTVSCRPGRRMGWIPVWFRARGRLSS
jgi:hypothetical protein